MIMTSFLTVLEKACWSGLRTDRRTDQRADRPSYRDAQSHLKAYIGLTVPHSCACSSDPEIISEKRISCKMHTHFFYKQHVYKHASLGFLEKLSTLLSTPSGSDWLEATKTFNYHLKI